MDNKHSHDNTHETDADLGPSGLAPGALYGVLAEFDSPGALVKAARRVRDAGYTEFDCYSPFPVHGIDEAMGIKRTILPALVFGGGIAGLIGGLFLQWYLNAWNWPWTISGKPYWSLPANIPIGFETTILLSVFTTFFGMWILNRLPQVWHPFFRLDRFAKVTDDGFMLGIEARDQRFDLAVTRKLLSEAGALEVEECRIDPDPAAKKMPTWIFGLIITSTVFALIPFAIIAKARGSKSSKPHYHIFSDMDFQAKAKSDTAFPLFPDGRANRGQVPGTIARGSLAEDDAYHRGLEMKDVVRTVTPPAPAAVDPAAPAGAPVAPPVPTTPTTVTVREPVWITGLPAQIEPSVSTIKRGQERYNIYCAPCHGYDGRGMGAIPKRVAGLGGAWPARNLVQANGVAIGMPNGQLYNTIANGFNTMSGYASQIPVADRWAIVLYVRALQRGQNAELSDDPATLQSVQ